MSSSSSRKGQLIVISGPSGVGKTSICEALLARDSNAIWSVSCTTRPPRGSEKNGRAYEFISGEEFEVRRKSGDFLEWAEFVGHLYGTPAKPVFDATEGGCDVIMEIDVQGGAQVARRVSDSTRIFVMPPTMDSLRARLEGRKTDSAKQLKDRLAKADGEIGFARDSGSYRHFVVNDILADTVQEIVGIIESERKELAT